MIGPQDGGFYFLVAIQQRIEFEWSIFMRHLLVISARKKEKKWIQIYYKKKKELKEETNGII